MARISFWPVPNTLKTVAQTAWVGTKSGDLHHLLETALWLIEAAVVSDFVVADSQLLSNLEAYMEDWLAVQPTEDDPVLVIAGLNLNPHPFTLAGRIVREFDFYMIARLIKGHCPTYSR